MAKADSEVLALAETLRGTSGADDHIDHAYVREFWAREPQRSLEPTAIQNPDQYKGEERVSFSCTQTDLPAAEQRTLVERWRAALPEFTNVRWLYFNSHMPQELFEAACKLPALNGLCMSWSGINDLTPLERCQQLQYLRIGMAGGVRSIEPLGKLASLRWLQIANVQIASLEPLRPLKNLEGLGFIGGESKPVALESFAPLADLTNLEWLHLGAVRTIDNSLRPLSGLKRLKFLGLANAFPVEEFAFLSLHVESSVCNLAQPYARWHSSVSPCRKCKKNWKVMTSGRPSWSLCPTCDSIKLARCVIKFNRARSDAKEYGR